MSREMTPIEFFRNEVFRRYGTASPFIIPARRSILSILQTVRPTTMGDEDALRYHFRCRRLR